jgi:hypothetical protein
MDPEFDAYKTWLGIPPEEQPPDYYGLLGLKRYEEDRQLIAKSSEQRLTHISRFKDGENGRLAQKIASELSKATSCLLNPHRKHLYDQHLRLGGGAAAAGQQASAPLPQHEVKPPERKPPVADRPETMASVLQGRRVKRQRGARRLVWLTATAVAALVLIAGVAWLSQTRRADEPTPVATKPAPSPPVEVIDAPENPAPREKTPPPATPTEKPAAPELPADTPSTPTDDNGAQIPSTTPSLADIGEDMAKPEVLEGEGYNALRFRGGDFVALEGTAGLIDPFRPFTVEMWVRFRPDVQSHFLFGDAVFGGVHPDVPNGVTAGWQVWVMKGDRGEHRIAVAAQQGFGSLVAAKADVWRHLAVCGGDGRISIFLDGRPTGQRAADAIQATYSPSPLPLHIGAHPYLHPDQPAGLQGDVRAFHISSVCRYVDGFQVPEVLSRDEHTEVLLDFAGNLSNRIADLSGNDHHGVLQGAEWFVDDRPLIAAPESVASKHPAKTPGTPSAEVSKQPVPDQEAQQAAQERFENVFKEELASAKRPQEHSALAVKLARIAGETKDEVATQYVLLEAARSQALSGMDWPAAFSLCEQTAERFDVDRRDLEVDTIQRGANMARAAESRKSLASHALTLVLDLVREGRFALADQVAQTSVTLASRSRDADLGKQARQVRDHVNSVKRSWTDAKRVLEQLKSSPEDPALNLEYGRFVCFQQGDWETGLPHLKKGSDSSLKLAAESDLRDPVKPEEQVAVADAWYEAAESVDRIERPGVLSRYLFWARQAGAELQGLARVDVEKRVQAVEKEVPSFLVSNERLSLADRRRPATAARFRPPPGYLGLVGRMQIEGVDVGVLWRYECSAVIGETTLADVLRGIRANPGRMRIELVGILHVPASTTVTVFHRGGSPEAGQAVLAVDGKVVSEVGLGRDLTEKADLDLAAGDHAVRWLISGTDLGSCAIRFADATTGQPLVAYHNPVMKATLKETPFRSRLDINVITGR